MDTYGGLTREELRERLVAYDDDAPDWEIVEDSAGGKEEYWGYLHRVGPVELMGRQPNSVSYLIVAAVNALAPLLDANDALRRRISELEALCADRL